MASENYTEMIEEAKRFVFITVFEGFDFNQINGITGIIWTA